MFVQTLQQWYYAHLIHGVSAASWLDVLGIFLAKMPLPFDLDAGLFDLDTRSLL